MLKKESILSLALGASLFAPVAFFLYQEGFSKGLSYGGIVSVVIGSGRIVIFFKSIIIAFVASLGSLIAGFIVSFSVTKTDLKQTRYFVFLVLIPLAVPPFVFVEALLFLSKLFRSNLFSLPVMIGIFSIVYMPIPTIIIGSGFLSIPKNIEESALLVSQGNSWFFRISMRWMLPFCITAFLITFLFVFSNYEIPSLMNIQTYTLFVFNQFGAFYNYKNAIYLLLPVFLLFLAIVVCTRAAIGQRSFFSVVIAPARLVCKLSKTQRNVLYLVLVFLAVVVLFPVIILVYKASFIRTFHELYRPYWKEIGYSFIVSSGAGLFTVAIASVFVRSMVLFSRKTKIFFSIVALAPFVIPPTFLAFSLIQLSGKLAGDGCWEATIILMWGLSTRYFPIIVYMLYASALAVNPHVIDAGHVTCPSWLRNFSSIWIPLNLSAMKKALYFFMLLSLSETGMAVLLVPPDCMTAAINIYSMLHYGFEREVAVETLLLVLVALSIGLMILFENKKSRQVEVTTDD